MEGGFFEMKMQWWGCMLTCPECKGETILQLVLFSADGQIQLSYWCPKCKEIYRWDVFATQLAHQALMNDMEKARKNPPTIQPVQPPLRLKPPLITDQDRNFAHGFGIDLEGEVT
jgi:hypothetical protein